MIRRLLCQLLGCHKKPDSLRVVIGPVALKGSGRMVQKQITNEQKVLLSIAPTTAAGKPANIDGDPIWQRDSGDDSIGVLGPVLADGRSVEFISGEGTGVATITVTADVDLDLDEIRNISETFEISVVSPEAERLNATVGEPELKPIL